MPIKKEALKKWRPQLVHCHDPSTSNDLDTELEAAGAPEQELGLGSDLTAEDRKTTALEAELSDYKGLWNQSLDLHGHFLLSLKNQMPPTTHHQSWEYQDFTRSKEAGAPSIFRPEGWSFKALKFSEGGQTQRRYSGARTTKGLSVLPTFVGAPWLLGAVHGLALPLVFLVGSDIGPEHSTHSLNAEGPQACLGHLPSEKKRGKAQRSQQAWKRYLPEPLESGFQSEQPAIKLDWGGQNLRQTMIYWQVIGQFRVDLPGVVGCGDPSKNTGPWVDPARRRPLFCFLGVYESWLFLGQRSETRRICFTVVAYLPRALSQLSSQ